MAERIISDEVLDTIRRTCYEAGRLGREVFTVRGHDGSEIVRCRDCKHGRVVENEGEADGKVYKAECATCSAMGAREWPYREFSVDPDGFCAWGARRDA